MSEGKVNKQIESAMQRIAKGETPHPPEKGLLIEDSDNVCCCGQVHASNQERKKHRLVFVADKGMLAEALGVTPEESKPIEEIVWKCVAENKSLRQLLEIVGELEISDAVWANFLYTFGYWDGARRVKP